MNEFFEYFYETENIRLKYACSSPAVSGEEYHDYYEMVIFLGGEVLFVSNDIQQKLKAGSIVLIPKGSFHQFTVSRKDYTRCILSFHGSGELESLVSSVLGKTKIIETPGNILKHHIDRLISVAKWDDDIPEKAISATSIAVTLLLEIQEIKDGIVGKNINISKPVHDAISIINNSYHEPITIEKLSKQLCVSPSFLSHRFKKELNISVYKYIIKKRLSIARQMIGAGVSVTDAATKSGFSDYSCFLRLYKNQYSETPSYKK